MKNGDYTKSINNKRISKWITISAVVALLFTAVFAFAFTTAKKQDKTVFAEVISLISTAFEVMPIEGYSAMISPLSVSCKTAFSVLYASLCFCVRALAINPTTPYIKTFHAPK